MDNQLLLISILLLITSLIIYRKYCYSYKDEEPFRLFYESSPSTRNMSYDLRCEPKIPKTNYLFRNSSIQPYYRQKCLELR